MAKEMQLGGYAIERNMLAQKYKRGEQSVFLLAMPLNLIDTYLPIPDPSQPFEGNRRVNLSRAVKFGEYWRNNLEWVAPPLLMDTTYKLTNAFEAEYVAGGVELGILTLPQDSKQQLTILDGQHRILGLVNAQQKLYGERKLYEEQLTLLDSEVTKTKLRNITDLINRLGSEFITVEIIEGISSETHKQYFHDIAVNAKGISKAVVAGFDQRSIANRVAINVTENHDLLAGNTDNESDRVGGSNPNLVSLKSVSDMVHEIVCGTTKRISVTQEKTLSDTNLEHVVTSFFELLIDSFADFRKISSGDLLPSELRERSMLSSPTIMRHLANAYGQLALDKSDLSELKISVSGLTKTQKLYKELSKHMALPVDKNWFATGYFSKDAKAPGSRTQELKGLSSLIVKWGETGEYWTD